MIKGLPNHILYGGSRDKFGAFDLNTGSVLWMADPFRNTSSTAEIKTMSVVWNGVLYITLQDGTVIA